MEFKALLEAVSLQAALLNELLGVLERETAELANVRIDAMNRSDLAKEELLRKISRNTQALQGEIAAAAGREGLPADVPLKVLAERLAQKGHGRMLELRNGIQQTATRIKRVAAMNHDVAERFATTIATSLKLVTRLINQSNTYGASGGYQKSSAGSVLINREA